MEPERHAQVLQTVPMSGFSHEAAATVLSADAVRRHLQRPEVACDLVGTTGSTNADLVARARAQAPDHAVLRAADVQTGGRGRLGRPWHGSAGGSLLFSVAVPWTRAPARSAAVTLACGLAAAQCLQAAGVEVQVKWPNDLLLDGRKLAGLLTEVAQDAAGRSTLVVGMGVNLALDEPERARIGHPVAELADRLGRAAVLAGRERWLAALAGALIDAAADFERRGFAPLQAAFQERCAFLGAAVVVRASSAAGGADAGHAVRGTLRGVDADGQLLIETAAGTCALASGELSLRALDAGAPR
jgi:BirA family biotin operon repressor/biotin-[acetyl-CoA-carboxylase] ligase